MSFVDVIPSIIPGNLTIIGDLDVQGSTTVVDTVTSGTIIVDVDNAEALLVRKDGDAGDILIVDTSNSEVQLVDDIPLAFGTDSNATLTYNTTQTVDTFYLAVSADSNNLLIAQKGDIAFDFSHALATNPTLFIHSANQSTTEWISITHNQTNGLITTGAGTLDLGTTAATSHSLGVGDVLIGGALEVDGVLWIDGTALIVNGATGNADVDIDWAENNSAQVIARANFSTDQFAFGMSAAVGRQFILTDAGNIGKDHDHASQTNPTLFIHSALDPDTSNNQWGSIAHDQENLIISTGANVGTGTGATTDVNGVSIEPSTLTSGGTGDFALQIKRTLNDSGAAGGSDLFNGIFMDITQTDVTGWDTVNLIDLQADTISAFSVSAAGNVVPGLNINMNAATRITHDLGTGAVMPANTNQTVEAMMLFVGATNNHTIIAQWADQAFDFSHTLQTNPTLYIHSANQATDEWISLTHDQTDGLISVGSGDVKFAENIKADKRILGKQGTDVASANDVTLGDGNAFEITGTTQINRLVNTSWQNGSQVTLLFTSNPTVKHGQASAGATITILLSGSGDFVASAGDTLTLMLSEIGGTQAWREVARTVI